MQVLAKEVYQSVPILIEEDKKEGNPWGISFRQGLFNMASDSQLFRTREQLQNDGYFLRGNTFYRDSEIYLPLYEAKMVNLYDHRHGNIVGSNDLSQLSGIPAVGTSKEEHEKPDFLAIPRYWVAEDEVKAQVTRSDWKCNFFICFRDVARSTDVRTAILSILPIVAVGHKAPLVLPFHASPTRSLCLLANLNAFALDFFVRQNIGGASLSFFIMKQLPVFTPSYYNAVCPWFKTVTLESGLFERVLELTYTAWDLEPFAKDCGYNGPPFRWDEDRRFLLRCELDAAYFHLYGIERNDVDYIMETFPIVKRKDEQQYGEYRTKRVILEIYDEMAEAIRSGESYQTRLDPPPADPSVAHPPKNAVIVTNKGI